MNKKIWKVSFLYEMALLIDHCVFLKKSLRQKKKKHYQISNKYVQMYKIPTKPEWLANTVVQGIQSI